MAKRSNDMSGWVGWVYFAGVMMAILGFFELIAAFTALFKDTYFVVLPNSIVSWNFTAWGWVHLVLGVIVLLAGFAVLAGQTWGRAIGVLMAVLAAVANMLFIPAYPIWSILMIVVSFLVIYALVAHGGEVAD
jgi:hypothetical protein